MANELIENQEYQQILNKIKIKIRSVQIKAAVSVNTALLMLYWDMGKIIAEKQRKSKWGDAIVERLAKDLKKEFPEMNGFSRTNLFGIRQWYLFYSQMDEKVQQLVGQLPWGHNLVIITKAKTPAEAVFYLNEAINHNWSRNTLVHQIESNLYLRQGRITHNFEATLPISQSDLAKQTLKDPYILDFLSLSNEAQEKEIEQALTEHITKFLLELGAGFSFVGNQFHLELAKQDYYIDLLFYHLNLRCYIAIELKTGEFKPEYAGKVNFYLSVIDKLLKQKEDNPSIGIILCKSKDRIIAEYALKDITKPIGVSEYMLVRAIPKKLKSNLPTIPELEKELSAIVKRQK